MSKSKKTSVAATLTGVFDTMQNRISDLDTKVDAITTNAAKGFVEQKQAIADNAVGTNYALESLKTSTQRALDGVSVDMAASRDCAQRHNARISKLEGDAGKTALDLVGIACQQMAFDDRLARLESKGVAAESLEEELKSVFKRHGYNVTSVGVKRQSYTYPTGFTSVSSATFSSQTVQNEAITIEIGGTKPL